MLFWFCMCVFFPAILSCLYCTTSDWLIWILPHMKNDTPTSSIVFHVLRSSELRIILLRSLDLRSHRDAQELHQQEWIWSKPMKRIHQTFLSRYFYVDAWLIHVWLCFFSRSDYVSQPKEEADSLMLFYPCKGLTVEQWQSWFMARGPVQMETFGVYASRIRKLRACLPREAMSLYYCYMSLWHFLSLYVCLIFFQIWTPTKLALCFQKESFVGKWIASRRKLSS